jgi:hypothetical protein
MAVPANTVIVSSRTNVKPDVEEVVKMITPVDTPVVTMAKPIKATGKYHEILNDELANASSNVNAEGDDDQASASAALVRTANRCQIVKSTASVSATSEVVGLFGYKSQISYEMAKRAKAVKRDLEFAASRNQPSAAAGAGDTMAGLESSIATNIVYSSAIGAGATPGFAGGDTVAPTDPGNAAVALTEPKLKEAMRLAWNNGGQPDMLVVGPVTKQICSGFGGIASLYRDQSVNDMKPASIMAAADVYVSDFGEIKILPSRHSRGQTALLIDTDYLAMATLRPWQTYELSRTGDNKKSSIVWEGCIVCQTEKAHAKIVNVTG